MTDTTARRLYVYNGGLLSKGRPRRILEAAGWDVQTGLPGAEDRVAVWGRSPTEWRGRTVSELTEAPVVTVEDAFLRSVQPGRVGDEPTSGLLLDETGVHFDGTKPSDLERLLATHPLDDTQLLNRARAVIERLKHWHLGKYSAVDPAIAPPDPGYVVVLDQAEGDASLLGATRADFLEMLTDARQAFPASAILIRRHPETSGGARGGHFRDEDLDARTAWAPDGISPWRLYDSALAVYTHSSLAGFEAVLGGHNPHVYGHPFYAGWGLTQDRQVFPRRERKLTRAQIVAVAYIEAPLWFDARTGQLCQIEDVISDLAARTRAWRDDRHGWEMGNISLWKRPHMKRAFGGRVRFVRHLKPTEGGPAPAVWGMADAPPGTTRIEDGFLRSGGLGAELTPPVSLALDAPSLYYDPRQPSRLDHLIAASADLPRAEIERAEALIDRLSRLGLTKYDIGPPSDGPRGILVAGQVEDDASIRLGTTEIATNAALLAAARAANPDAHLIWKPHPDTLAGLRTGGTVDTALADEVATGPAAAALARADAVWTMTSTLGFEALIRGIPVTCAGTPFYAGWGLTTDLAPTPPHRTARPSLAGLAHACLIGYPRYFDPETGTALSPEAAVDLLASGQPMPRANRLLARLQGLAVTLGLR